MYKVFTYYCDRKTHNLYNKLPYFIKYDELTVVQKSCINYQCCYTWLQY